MLKLISKILKEWFIQMKIKISICVYKILYYHMVLIVSYIIDLICLVGLIIFIIILYTVNMLP
jgi:hypothetical protein